MKNKINVNISPNPLDLQTLHCSQNDTGERKFYFTLHNNGEVIDTTDISDPIFEPFDVYKGGTEQLLPVNTGVPTTSPIIADIQYPDEEKTEQEFTYRESPTTIDGKAKLKSIKGNTIKWNQLAKELSGNFGSSGGTVTVTNNIATLVPSAGNFSLNTRYLNVLGTSVAGHKYLYSFTVSRSKGNENVAVNPIGEGVIQLNVISPNTATTFSGTITATSANNYRFAIYPFGAATLTFDGTESATMSNIMLFDLTAMFGAGNEPATVEEFTALFSLSYYQYDAGSLLSFNGTGIKTTGKNLVDVADFTMVGTSTTQIITLSNFANILTVGTTYTLSFDVDSTGDADVVFDGQPDSIFANKPNSLGYDKRITTSTTKQRFSVTGEYLEGTTSFRFYRTTSHTGLNQTINISNIQIEYGSSATDYEPYKETITDLPISTYFPTGMKSAGTVYDELTNSKAITRVGEVDLGTLEWTKVGAISMFYAVYQTDGIFHSGNELPNITNARYAICSANTMYANRNGIVTDDVITVNAPFLSPTEQRIIVADTSYNDATAFKNAMAMDGVYLQYELEEEQVTEFTHASLICEDGESTLYQDVDSLVCECTEDFSKDSGFKDCKIKITNDDGVVYSNKIQLHIERKP